MTASFVYPALALAGIVLSSILWTWVLRNDPVGRDRRLELVYIAALCGAILGAKAVYFLAEGWLVLADRSLTNRQIWIALLTGKTVTGALLGGYLAVEIAKKAVNYTKPTGDLFAVVAPFGLMLGRIGCFVQGCCPGVAMDHHWFTMDDASGVARWPAVPLEFAFNVAMFVVALSCYRKRLLRGQLFHVYLIAYGVFRAFHEYFREVPPILGPITGYQFASVAIVILGVVRFRQRARTAPNVYA